MGPETDASEVVQLLEDTAVRPARPVDPAALRAAGRRRARRRTVLSVAATTVALVAGVLIWQPPAPVPTIDAIIGTPDDGGVAQVPLAAGDPEHALLVLGDGTLVVDELATGQRTELAEPLHAGSAVLDLAVSVGSTVEDFTAVAYDDGTGPTGFVTYARRNGGPVEVTFTGRELWPGNISNRGFRTIAPDGRWLAYSGVAGQGNDALTTYLVPLDADTAKPQLERTVVLDEAIGPLEWTGPVTGPGDASRITGRRDGELVQLQLERIDGGFTVTGITPPLSAAGIDDRSSSPQIAFASQLPGSEQDPRFVLTDQRAEVEIGEPASLDRAIVAYTGLNDHRAEVEVPLGYNIGNLDFSARGATALLITDRVLDDPTQREATTGRAFLLRLKASDTGQVTFDDPVQLADGPTTGALLGGLTR